MHSNLKALHILALLALLTQAARLSGDEGEVGDSSLLTLERIFGQREFEVPSFSAKWLDDASGYTRVEDSTSKGRDLVLYNPDGDGRQIVVPAAHLIPTDTTTPLEIDGYAWSKDRSLLLIYTNSKRVWRQNTRGDYWLLDRSSRELRQLGGDAKPSTLMFAKFSPTGRHVAYVRENNIYVEDLQDRSIAQITQTASSDIINGTFDWVYEEELGLRDGFRWSPDGKSIAYWQLDTSGVPEFPLVNNTAGLYPRVTNFAYPKVGQRNSACRAGVVSVDGGQTRWLDVPGDPRNHYIARLDWAQNSDEIILQQLNRRQNTNRVMLADARTGTVKTILVEHDPAWVDIHDELHWLAGGNQFTWISERDGWRHIYLASRSGDDIRLITPGNFDVIELLQVDERNGCVYFIASPDDASQRYLYRAALDGSEVTRVTPAEARGTYLYDIAPDGRRALVTSSSFDEPPVTRLVSLPEHQVIREVADNRELHEKVEKLNRSPAEFLRVEIGNGVSLDGWCIKPPEFDASKRYPLLVYVYGEPAGQTVLDRWGGDNYLWHQMLAQQGYVVMSFDNRGTRSPRGRQWRKCVFQKVGVLAPQEQAAALQTVLRERPYLDAKRVGIWGWSGGGSMSLNAIFKYPDLYGTAVSVAPVPNQRYYDTIYQERYMGLPGDNVDGFTQGSPINFAHQLKGNLLLIHGTGDDNCHYQTTEMLIDELIRHNRRFTMMAYPNRTHAIREGHNTTLHLRGLMTWYLNENLRPSAGAGE